MMKVLTGIYTRDAGSLLWLGKETTFNGPKSSREAGIGIIHQELNLIPQLTIAENIFLGREFVNRFGKIDWKKMYAEADLYWPNSTCALRATARSVNCRLATSRWSKLPKC